jgi:hypothetical protein
MKILFGVGLDKLIRKLNEAINVSSPVSQKDNARAERLRAAHAEAVTELVVRFNFILSAAIGFVALMLTTCASPSRLVWEYYDQCARENPSFLAMAECGRQKRLAECVPNNTCSA